MKNGAIHDTLTVDALQEAPRTTEKKQAKHLGIRDRQCGTRHVHNQNADSDADSMATRGFAVARFTTQGKENLLYR